VQFSMLTTNDPNYM